jgi:hypothetical protein
MISSSNSLRKRVIGVLLVIIALAVLAAPFGIIAHHFGDIFKDSESSLDILHSLAALIAISFLFLDIVTGSFRPLLARIFRQPVLYSTHVYFGVAGLSFAVAHFILLIPHFSEYLEKYNRVLILVGALALVLLPATIATALMPRRFSKLWRLFHLANYFIFFIAVIHALAIGENNHMLAFNLLMYGYLAIAVGGLAYRAISTHEWKQFRSPGTSRTKEAA